MPSWLDTDFSGGPAVADQPAPVIGAGKSWLDTDFEAPAAASQDVNATPTEPPSGVLSPAWNPTGSDTTVGDASPNLDAYINYSPAARGLAYGAVNLAGTLGTIATTVGTEAGIPGAAEQRAAIMKTIGDYAEQERKRAQNVDGVSNTLAGAGAMATEIGPTMLAGPWGFLGYGVAKSTANQLALADRQGRTGFADKYLPAAAHGAVDAASMYLGGKYLGAGVEALAGLGGDFADTVAGKAVQYLTDKFDIGPSVAKMAGIGGEAGSQGVLGGMTNIAHYLLDVAEGRQKFSKQGVIDAGTEGLPENLVVGGGFGAIHTYLGKVADTLAKRQERLGDTMVAVQDASDFAEQASTPELEKVVGASSRKDFEQATGQQRTTQQYRETFAAEAQAQLDKLNAANQQLEQSATKPVDEPQQYAMTKREQAALGTRAQNLRDGGMVNSDTADDLDWMVGSRPDLARQAFTEAQRRSDEHNLEMNQARGEWTTVFGKYSAEMVAKAKANEGGDSVGTFKAGWDTKVHSLEEDPGRAPIIYAEAMRRGDGDLDHGLFDLLKDSRKFFANKKPHQFLPGVVDEVMRPLREQQQGGTNATPEPNSDAQQEPQGAAIPTGQSGQGGQGGDRQGESQEAAPAETGVGANTQDLAAIIPPQAVIALQNAVHPTKALPKFTDFLKSVSEWSSRGQQSTGEIKTAARMIKENVPDHVRREAITNWIQAGGDDAVLAQRAAASKEPYKQGYEAARALTNDELHIANEIQQTYATLLKRANDHGIGIAELPNYVTQLWRRQPLKEFFPSSSKKISDAVAFSKHRFYESYFHGEQNGLKPQTKDIAALLPVYMNEVNNAVNAKQFVASLTAGTGKDGRPLVATTGATTVVDDPRTGSPTYFVVPKMPVGDSADYRALDKRALQSWTWQAGDADGSSVVLRGDLRVHPEIYSHLKNVLSRSAIREWWDSPSRSVFRQLPKEVSKFLADDVQSAGKATMLGFFSPFHQVQEGTHAIGHRVDPFFNLDKIDLTNPDQIDATAHGLMLLPDSISAGQFREGLDGGNKNVVAALLGRYGGPAGKAVKQWSQEYQDYLFEQYIPSLKYKTYEHMLDRNRGRYAPELSAGEVTDAQIKHLSAEQANVAYGHLNYAVMGHNPTMMHLAQMFLLAPDFLEARGKFALQGALGTPGVSKMHREQFAALATLAGVTWVGARALNQAINGDPRFDKPFSVVAGNREYRIRSVPDDIYRAFADTRKFVGGRLSPLLGRGLLDGLSGVNYRGEKTPFTEMLSNMVAGMVPISLQPITRGLTETGRDNPVSPFEQFLGSIGLHVSRYSPVQPVYDLAHSWIDKNGEKYGIKAEDTVYPISKYQRLRYALEDDDQAEAVAEIASLTKDAAPSARTFPEKVKESLTHPFTGSQRTDAIFRNSLNEHDKQLFDAAEKRRQLLLVRLGHALEQFESQQKAAATNNK